MKLSVDPISNLKGSVAIPGSKSQSVRALLVATLAAGVSEIHCLPDSEDVNTALQVCRDLGARVEKLTCHENCQRVESEGAPLQPVKEKLWTGNSGITTRFVLPILGLCNKPMEVDAGEQMKKRPMALIQNLKDLGMSIDEAWPIRVSGQLKGGETMVDGLTSQYLSALLLSATYAESDVTLTVKDLNERPYVEMTLQWLRDLGTPFEHTHEGNADRFVVEAGHRYSPIQYFVPADFSSASTLLAAGALIPGEVRLEGLAMHDLQGDRRLVEILKEMGADLSIEDRAIVLRGGKPLKGLAVDANDIPDLVPTLAVLGTQASGKMEIVNVPQARFKETDRLHSMSDGLMKMGAKIEEKEDGLVVWQSALQGAEVHGYEDHRTIMALALAGLLAKGKTTVDTAEGLNKTYPLFGDHMNQLGASLILQ